jgi:WD40 repeat protein
VAAVSDVVQVHSILTGRYERLQKLDGGHITSLAIAPSGEWMAAGIDNGRSHAGCTCLYRLGRAEAAWQVSESRELVNAQDSPVRHVAFSPDSEWLATCDDQGWLSIWQVAEGRPICRLQMPESIAAAAHARPAAFSPDGQKLAAAGNRRVVVWDCKTWTQRQFDELHHGPITCLLWSPDGRWLISAAGDGLAVWDVASGRPPGPLVPLDGANDICALLFLGDGEWLLSGSTDKRFLLWNWRRNLPLAWQFPEELRR